MLGSEQWCRQKRVSLKKIKTDEVTADDVAYLTVITFKKCLLLLELLAD